MALRDRLSPQALAAGLSQTRLPSPRVSTLLVLAFAGFGVLLGSLAGSPVNDTLAAQVQRPVKLLLPATRRYEHRRRTRVLAGRSAACRKRSDARSARRRTGAAGSRGAAAPATSPSQGKQGESKTGCSDSRREDAARSCRRSRTCSS